jgi:PTS system mannose-specific IIA component
MVGVVIVGHGRIAQEMLRTLQAVVGRLEGIEAVASAADASPRQLREKIAAAMRRAESGDGVLLLTDMLGDSQTNQCLALARDDRTEVIAGVNMPILVKVTTSRADMPLRDLARFLRRYGQEHIIWATETRAAEGAPAAGPSALGEGRTAVPTPPGDEPPAPQAIGRSG